MSNDSHSEGDGTILHRLEGHPSIVVSLAWSSDGRMLAAGSRGPEGGQLTVWNVHRGERMYTLTQHLEIVNGLAWGPTRTQSSVAARTAGYAGGTY